MSAPTGPCLARDLYYAAQRPMAIEELYEDRKRVRDLKALYTF